ncbi:MAG: hypothetical protein M3Q23_16185 [Actinomycetota bacterium]|nr:hypothetical protein [Actinomycetota bacterium]
MDEPGSQEAKPATVAVTVTIGTPSIQMRSHLWIQWTEIAMEHETEAIGIRAEALRTRQDGGEIAGLLGREMRASMVSIAAAAHSIDALYGALQEATPNRPMFAKGTPRRGKIIETLKYGLDLRGETTRWESEFRWLFNLRGGAVHFKGEFTATVPHPLGTNTAPEAVAYSQESAIRAVDFLSEVLSACSKRPKPTVPEMVKWATDYGPAIERLLASRAPRPEPTD